jgi:hypothetical protein
VGRVVTAMLSSSFSVAVSAWTWVTGAKEKTSAIVSNKDITLFIIATSFPFLLSYRGFRHVKIYQNTLYSKVLFFARFVCRISQEFTNKKPPKRILGRLF